jgi:hypothetical protein
MGLSVGVVLVTLLFVIFTAKQVCLQGCDPVEEQYPVEVVHFVLDSHSLKTVRLYFAGLARSVNEPDGDGNGPFNVAGVIGDAHAPFAHDCGACPINDFRVYQFQEAVVVPFPQPVAGNVNHADPQGDADLGSGNADRALSRSHGIAQIANQPGYFRVNVNYRTTGLF